MNYSINSLFPELFALESSDSDIWVTSRHHSRSVTRSFSMRTPQKLMLLSTKSNFCSGEKQTERKIKGREIKDVIGERFSFGSLLVLSQINTGSNRCGIDLPFAAAGMVEKNNTSLTLFEVVSLRTWSNDLLPGSRSRPANDAIGHGRAVIGIWRTGNKYCWHYSRCWKNDARFHNHIKGILTEKYRTSIYLCCRIARTIKIKMVEKVYLTVQ